MTYILLLIATGALAFAFVCWRRVNALQVELVKSRSMIFDLSRGVREIREELKQARRQMQVLMKQGGGTFRIEKTTRVKDAMVMHPGIRDVFASFHLGGEATSAINEDDTIEQVAHGHQKDVDQLVDMLNNVFDQDVERPVMPDTGDSGLLKIGMMPEE